MSEQVNKKCRPVNVTVQQSTTSTQTPSHQTLHSHNFQCSTPISATAGLLVKILSLAQSAVHLRYYY